MQRLVIALLALAVGASAGYLLGSREAANRSTRPVSTAAHAPPPLEVYVPPAKLSAAEVVSHRGDNYRAMTSIADVLELPNDFTQTEALYALAGRADADELDTLIRQATGIADRFDRRAALQILYLRYSEIDPQAAVEHLRLSNLDIDTQIIGTIFRSWAKEDVNAAIAAANAMDNLGQRRRAGNAILQTFSQTDPGRLDEVASRLEGSHDTAHFEAQAIATSANHSPRLALDQALSLPTLNARHRAVYSVAGVWARNDPEGAFAHGLAFDNTKHADAFLEAVVARWVSDDAQAALDAVRAIPEPGRRDNLLANAIYHLAGYDPQQAFSIASTLEGRNADATMQRVVDRWMQGDPAGALAAVQSVPESPRKQLLLGAAGRQYAQRDPQAALLWASQLPEQTRSQVYVRMLNQVARSDPQQALEIALSDDSGQRNRMIGAVIRSASQHNPELAAGFIERLPAGELRRNATTQVASNWASRDPGAALAWVETLDDRTYLHTIGSVSYQIAQSDPEMAAAYIDRLRPEARETWVSNVASALGAKDVQRALAFARQFGHGPLYDMAMQAAIGQIGYSNPAEALRLSSSLSADARTQLATQIASQWASSDPAAAARYVDAQRDLSANHSVLEAIAGQWAQHDARAAQRWALSKPAGEPRDRIIAGVLTHSGIGGEEAVRLINSIHSDDARERAATNAYVTALRGSPSAADALLDRLALSPGQRANIVRIAEAWNGS